MLLEDHIDDIARIITQENGKTFTEAKAEMRRAIENVEVACGIPMMMQGYNLEDVARGIDEMMIRQPLGVTAAIVPFNFPGMIAFWYLPYAIATGNTFILKPSERVPLTMRYVYELLEKTGLPKGVVNLVNGSKAVVDALIDHPKVRAISFVGSTPVARYIYARSGEKGKRCQCQGGAKNHVIVLPDADMPMATQIISDSAFGCAGQRCLAVSVAVTIGEAQKTFRDSIADAASKLKVGNGLDEGVQMGPVITPQSKERVESLIATRRKAGRESSARRPQLEDPEIRIRQLREADHPRQRSQRPAISPTRRSSVQCSASFTPTTWTTRSPSSNAAPTAIRRRCSHRADRRRAASATKRPREISASTSESPRPWPTSRSADGRTASSAISTARAATPSSSTPTRKS